MAAQRRRSRFSPAQPHPVRSAPLDSPKKRKGPRVGFLRPGHVERAFLALLYLTLLTLVVLSIIGTYYGVASEEVPIFQVLPGVAPIFQPFQIVTDIQANTDRLWVALVIQAFLTLAQYGARQLARHDPRWWFLYLAALGISVYYNFQAYWGPLSELAPGPVVAMGIVAGDVLPEFIAIRHEE